MACISSASYYYPKGLHVSSDKWMVTRMIIVKPHEHINLNMAGLWHCFTNIIWNNQLLGLSMMIKWHIIYIYVNLHKLYWVRIAIQLLVLSKHYLQIWYFDSVLTKCQLCITIYKYCCPVINWLVVSAPLKNISQLGWLFPIYGTIKHVPNHQPNKYCDHS